MPDNTNQYQLYTYTRNFNPRELLFPLRGFFHDQYDTPPHQQEYAEVVFFLHGEGLHYTESTGWQPVRRGEVFSLPPGGIHGFKETRGLKIFNLLFIPDALPLPMLDLCGCPGYKLLFGDDGSEKHPYPHLHLSPAEIRRMESMLRLFAFFHQEELDGNPSGKYGLFMAIISRLCHLAVQDKTLQTEPLSITRIHQFLNSNCSRTVTIAELCRLTAMSPATLHRHFLRFFGLPPLQYIRKYRLQIACRLLLNTTLTIQEISTLCGFPKQSYFNQIFRSVHHMTPGEYRKSSARSAEKRSDRQLAVFVKQ